MAETVQVEKVPYGERLLLDAHAAADMLSVSPKTLATLPIKRIRLTGSTGKIDRILFKKSDLEEYVRSLQ